MRLLPSLSAVPALGVASLAAALLVGCGGSDSGTETSNAAPANAGSTATAETRTAEVTLPTASIGNTAQPAAEAEPAATGTQGVIEQITTLMRQPLAGAEGADDPKRIPQLIKQRNKTIVDMASRGVLLAHKNNESDEVMHQLVQRLSEARLQLALQGDQDEAESLYSDADVLQEQHPGSKAAMEASYAVVRFANTNAMRYSQNNTEWITEFARRARTFCEAFPSEQAKTLPLLLAAGKSCEGYNLTEEAKLCYAQILEQYPDTPQGEQAKGVLRRLSLTGQTLKFGGATYGGEFFNINQNRGKVTAIVYWNSHIGGIQETLKKIDTITSKYEDSQLQVIGVSLDDEELQLEVAVGDAGISWPQLFDPDASKRGWQHPVVKYYGVLNVPSIWLVDANGTVVSTNTSEADLETKLAELIK